MKRSRYTAEQVAFALRQAESGTQVPEVCRKMGITIQANVTVVHAGLLFNCGPDRVHDDGARVTIDRTFSAAFQLVL